MPADALQFTLRQLRDLYSRPRNLAVLAVVSAVLGLAGPFGTYADFGLGARIAYWAAIVFVTYAVGLGATMLLSALLRARLRQVVARALVAGALGGVPVTLVVIVINLLAYGDAETLPPLPLLGYCCAISAGVALVLVLFVPEASSGDAAPAIAEAAANIAAMGSPPILDRLPPMRRGRLLALSVSDHYVDVVTERGTTLVLMRLSDAIRETGSVPGLQIHRSHWVALEAVNRSVREDGRVLLELVDGRRLPVSRGAMPAVRAARLLS